MDIIVVEYVWIDANKNLRSKAKTILLAEQTKISYYNKIKFTHFSAFLDILPLWIFGWF